MKKQRKSAGILLYRKVKTPECFLVHPGGPFWAKKDAGSWSMPKGEFDDEEAEAAARREFAEETGTQVSVPLVFLGSAKLKSGKTIYGFAGEQDLDETKIVSNVFPLKWPPGSGKEILVPEVDKGGWFSFEEAAKKIHAGQLPLLLRLNEMLTER